MNLIIFLFFGLGIPLGSVFVGNGLVRLLKADAMRIPLACRAGLGFVVLIFLLILLGALQLYTPAAMWGVGLIWLAASIPGFRQVRKEPFFTEAFPHGDPTWNPLFLRVGLSVMLLICLMNTMTPESRHDPYDYHLAIPSLYLAYQGIVEIPWHVFAYMPKNSEILYGLALGIGNDSLTKLLHFLFGCLCVLSISSWIKRIAGHEASMLAGLLVVTLPLFGFLATLSYIDLARSFWELSALYMLYQMWDESDSRTQVYSLILSGLFAGMALGTKYVSMLVFFPPYLILVGLSLWWRQRNNLGCLTPLWMLAVLIPLAPWLIFNVLWTGNPIYPLFPSIFGMHIPPAQDAYEFIRNHAPPTSNLTLWALPGLFWKRLNNLLLDGNSLVLIGIVAWATSTWWREQSISISFPRYARRGLLLYTILSSFLFLIGSENMDGRFFVSTVFLMVIPVVFFLYALSNSIRQTSPWGRYVIPGFALILFANAVTYRFNQMKDLDEFPLPLITEAQRDQWLNHRFTYYKVATWANENLPSDAVVLGMGYPLRHKYIAKIKQGYLPFLEGVDPNLSPDDLVKLLRDNHVNYIVKPFIELTPNIDFSILEPNHMIPICSHRGIVLYELLPPKS